MSFYLIYIQRSTQMVSTLRDRMYIFTIVELIPLYIFTIHSELKKNLCWGFQVISGTMMIALL